MGNNTNESDEIEIDLLELLGLLLHRWWIIIITALVCGVIGFLVSYFVLPEEFESTTTVYIINKNEGTSLTYNDLNFGTQMTKDYAGIIKCRAVLEAVIERYDLDVSYAAFSNCVSVSTQSDTRIVSITVKDGDPYMAKLLADEVRNVASEMMENVMDLDAVNLVDEGDIPLSPSSPNITLWTLAGALVGAAISIGMILIGYLQDDTIKVSDDVERYLGLSTLGMIPINDEQDEHKHSKKKSSGKKKGSSSSGRSSSGGRSSSSLDDTLEEVDLDEAAKAKNDKKDPDAKEKE